MHFLGTNSLLLKGTHTSVMVDPFISRPSLISLLKPLVVQPDLVRRTLEACSAGNLKAVFLTHTHYDHALDAPEIAAQTGALLIGSESTLRLGRSAGLPEQQLRCASAGMTIEAGEFTVSFQHAMHLPFPGLLAGMAALHRPIQEDFCPPARFWQYWPGDVFSLLIQKNDRRILLQGSASVCPGEHSSTAAETAVLSIGGLGLQSKKFRQTWFEQNVVRPGVKQLFLSHWDDFTRPLQHTPRILPGTRLSIRHIQEMAAQNRSLTIRLLQMNAQVEI